MIDKDNIAFVEKLIYTIGIVTGWWKFVDALFSFLHKRQRGFIIEIVKEYTKEEISLLKATLDELKKIREEDSRWISLELRKIFEEIKK